MDIPEPSNLQDQAADMASQAGQAAQKTIKSIGEKADCWLRKSRDCIEKHPISCIAAALAIGAVIGYVTMSDRSGKAEK